MKEYPVTNYKTNNKSLIINLVTFFANLILKEPFSEN
jgi:hypothetical protein